jgi:hypothetical protein
MSNARAPGWLLAFVTLLIGLSCGGDSDRGTGPARQDPGPVHLVLSTPNSDDGGVVVAVTGGPVTSLASAGFEFTGTAGPTGARAIVRGRLVGGIVLILDLPDRHRLGEYIVQLQEVAAGAPAYQARSLAGYQASLVLP